MAYKLDFRPPLPPRKRVSFGLVSRERISKLAESVRSESSESSDIKDRIGASRISESSDIKDRIGASRISDASDIIKTSDATESFKLPLPTYERIRRITPLEFSPNPFVSKFQKLLVNAIIKNNPNGINGVKNLLKLVNPSFSMDYPLRFASELGYEEIVKILLKDKRVRAHSLNNEALYLAALNNRIQVVNLLLQHTKVDQSTLFTACLQGHTTIVEMLVSDKSIDPSIHNNFCLKLAIRQGNKDLVKLLLNDDRVYSFDMGRPSMLLAADNLHFDVVELLLNKRFSQENERSFRIAAENGYTSVIKILLHKESVDGNDLNKESLDGNDVEVYRVAMRNAFLRLLLILLGMIVLKFR
jgi:ankyrin repeat protein